MMESFPKVVQSCSNSHDKQIRGLLTLAIEKGPDFVRGHVVTGLVALAPIDKNSATSLLKTLCGLTDWRVRYAICTNISTLVESLGASNIFPAFLTKAYSDMLIDQNPECKVIALENLPNSLRYVDSESASTYLLPNLKIVVNDKENAVAKSSFR